MTDQVNNQLENEELSWEQKREQLLFENSAMYASLTKRNYDFMFQFMKEIRSREDFDHNLAELENEMLTELIAGQKKGKTAKQLYGTPIGYVDVVINRPTQQNLGPSPFWHLWVDGGLLIGGVFSAIAGFSLLMANTNADAQSTGILSLLVNFIVGGFVMAILTKNQPDLTKPKGERGTGRYIILAVSTLALWIGFISVTSVYVPASINPVMPPFIYIAIAAIALVVRWWFKREYKVKNTFL